MSISKAQPRFCQEGFTLTELLTSVAIIGVMASIAVPVYSGYIESTRTGVVKDQLRAIHMQQQEYFAMYNSYYVTGGDCTDDSKSAINTVLFSGQNVLTEDAARFCITQEGDGTFLAQAVYGSGDDESAYTVDQDGTVNF